MTPELDDVPEQFDYGLQYFLFSQQILDRTSPNSQMLLFSFVYVLFIFFLNLFFNCTKDVIIHAVHTSRVTHFVFSIN